jgi:hypothetical protein
MVVALASVPAPILSHVLLGAIILQALWFGALALLLLRGALVTATACA